MTSRFKRKQHIDIAQPYNITYVLNTCLRSLQKQHLGYPLIICKLEMQTVLNWALVVLNLVPSLSSLSCFHQRSTKAVRGRASAYSRWPYQHQLIKYMSGESFFMQFSNSKHEMYLLWWDWLQESRLQWQRDALNSSANEMLRQELVLTWITSIDLQFRVWCTEVGCHRCAQSQVMHIQTQHS